MSYNLEQIKAYAMTNNVPIINDDGLQTVLNVLKNIPPKRVLEIGTAIGYFALNLHEKFGAEIVTIERNPQMYEQAKINVQTAKLEKKIELIFADALEVDETKLGKFDFIFIDAAKSQNIKFFEKYSPLLKQDGLIIVDNLAFHGLATNQDNQKLSRNLRQMMRKINDFIVYMNNHPDYSFEILQNGDGLGIIRAKEQNV